MSHALWRRLAQLEALTVPDAEADKIIRTLTLILSGHTESEEKAEAIAQYWGKVIGPQNARKLKASLIWGRARVVAMNGLDPAWGGPEAARLMFAETWTPEDVARIKELTTCSGLDRRDGF